MDERFHREIIRAYTCLIWFVLVAALVLVAGAIVVAVFFG